MTVSAFLSSFILASSLYCCSAFVFPSNPSPSLATTTTSSTAYRRRSRPLSSSPWKGDGQQLGGNDPDDLLEEVRVAVEQASLMERAGEESDESIPVRFVNFDESNPLRQTVTYAPKGKNVLKIADEVGIHIPRNCRSGLCGSCTADVKDPSWNEPTARAGYQTIRTCQAGAMIPAGCEEMVIDLYRMLPANTAVEAGGEGALEGAVRVSSPSPMKNFDDGWEDEFSPDYKTGGKPTSIQKQKATVVASSTPAYTLPSTSRGGSEKKEKFKRWRPDAASNIAPWDIVY